eukprot:TRINITY_DN2243_c0_g1_i3.p1 TRINITY_DN2243_c0_g1~~TRINITY_DN2243_c0_g1_i3.p1  ORF type:complete len:230 (+),score=39.53 TRINITY_DN2243_c0_g1_i3:981-1670(+)
MFLLNYHIHNRSLWFTRHGESISNFRETIGGDSDLSPNGKIYARALAKFASMQSQLQNCNIWTSTLKRTKQTIEFFPPTHWVRSLITLNEIDAGNCEGMTYQEIKLMYPEEYESRSKNKLTYRYPGGESYLDLISRIQPLIIELERMKETILVVGHQAVLRTILAYFLCVDLPNLPYIEIPLHCILCLIPTPHGIVQTSYQLDLDKFQSNEEDVFWSEHTKEYFYKRDG